MLAIQSSEDRTVADYPPVGLPGFEMSSCREVSGRGQLSVTGELGELVFELIISRKVIGLGGELPGDARAQQGREQDPLGIQGLL